MHRIVGSKVGEGVTLSSKEKVKNVSDSGTILIYAETV